MKFAVCAILKNENLYLREWVEHYINLGFDKIILYDNNDTNGEIPNVIIQDYIDQGMVDIIEFKNKNKQFYSVQTDAYNLCLQSYKDECDWIAFFDIDEFLYIEKYKKIQYLFENSNYQNFDEIIVFWQCVGENKIYYENKSVQERFTTPLNYIFYYQTYNITCNNFVKSFIKTSANIYFNDANMHYAFTSNVCNAICKLCYMPNNSMCNSDIIHNVMYLKHYPFKSLYEYLHRKRNNIDISLYKQAHCWTEEHEKVYQKFLKDNNIEAPE